MVEPQEPGAAEKILEAQEKFFEETKKEQQELPEQMVAVARAKLESFQALKTAIDEKLAALLETKEEICALIKDNIQSEAHPDGLLTKEEASYLKCLEVEHIELRELLQQDQMKWVGNFEVIKREAEKIKDSVNAIFEKQQ